LKEIAEIISFSILKFIEAPIRFELMHKGFADLSLTTWVRRHKIYFFVLSPSFLPLFPNVCKSDTVHGKVLLSSSLPFPLLSNNSRRSASSCVENSSLYIKTKGRLNFVDFVFPALCSFKRRSISDVYPIYRLPSFKLFKMYTVNIPLPPCPP
jgi:hypothetical protein